MRSSCAGQRGPSDAAIAAITWPSRSVTWLSEFPSPASDSTSSAVTTETCGVHDRTRAAWSAPAASMTTTGWSRCSHPSQNGQLNTDVPTDRGDRRSVEFVLHPRRQHDGVAAEAGAVGERHRHAPLVARRSADRAVDDAHAVHLRLRECVAAETTRADPSRVGEAVELLDGCVARRVVLDHGDPMPGSGQHEGCRQAGGPTADDQHVADDIAGGLHHADTSVGAETSVAAMRARWTAW